MLAYAAEEAERLGHKHIGTEHLLLGLLREEKCFASEILQERGLKLAQIRDELARVTQEKAPPQQRQRESSLLAEFSRDLTQAAMDGQLDPLVGRDGELERVDPDPLPPHQEQSLRGSSKAVEKAAANDGSPPRSRSRRSAPRMDFSRHRPDRVAVQDRLSGGRSRP